MNTVLFTVENGIATVTMNRPEALNALNLELRQDLAESWRRINEDDEIRVAIVTGAGRAFCAGMDVKEAAQRMQQGGPAPGGGDQGGGGAGYDAMNVFKPILAAVNGAAAGGGLGIALSCDILIAAEGTIFTCPFVARGTLNPLTTTMLMKKVPPGWAMWMALSGSRVDAHTALRIGLVNEVVPQAELLDRAYEMAERIVANSYVAVLATKEKMRLAMEQTMAQALAEDGVFARAWRNRSEAKEGFSAFAEKRRAQFE
ncbi:MAG: enoyl-CoA hydratase/isomerase family protein [Chloroflexi bacterium]|nr:enoyl-CoA hydratase/isomerase family protein [Chloroflexota bacterium]